MANPKDPYAASHVSPSGAGDARPTALQVLSDLALLPAGLSGRTVLVTGSSSGIGVETARALYAAGATVYMQVRNLPKGSDVLHSIQASHPHSTGSLSLLEMRLDSLSSVRAGAAALLSKTATLNILINNAGTRNTPEGRTEDGFETQLATNHLGHFLLFQLLRPALLAGSSPQFQSRVVNVTSAAHRRGAAALDNLNLEGAYDPRRGYAASKTANIWMANHVERLFGAEGLHGLSVHPGCVVSGLQQAEDVEKRLAGDAELRTVLKSAAQGAATQVWAAAAPVWEGRGALYLEEMREGREMGEEEWTLTKGGYLAFIFDEESERELWRRSAEMVGVEE